MKNSKEFMLNKTGWIVSFLMNAVVTSYIIDLTNRPYGAISEFVDLLFYYPFIVFFISFIFRSLPDKIFYSIINSIALLGFTAYDMLSSPEFPDFNFDLSEIGILAYIIFTPLVLSTISFFIIKFIKRKKLFKAFL